jgi:hypothetical protein
MTELAAAGTARTDHPQASGEPTVEALRDALRAAAAGDFAVRVAHEGPGRARPPRVQRVVARNAS